MSAATWEFEASDPEVGFLGDTATHTCMENVDAETYDVQPAEIIDQTLRNVDLLGVPLVAETTTFRCPACGATTITTDHLPRSMFEEPR